MSVFLVVWVNTGMNLILNSLKKTCYIFMLQYWRQIIMTMTTTALRSVQPQTLSEDKMVFVSTETLSEDMVFVSTERGRLYNCFPWRHFQVIVLNQHLRTISNILVANLAVADIVMFVFSVPFDIIQWNVITWPQGTGGKVLCKLGGAVWVLSQVLCVASLTAVSIERYCSIRWNIQLKRTVVILGIVWAISVLFSVPILNYANVEYFGYDISFCYIIPPWGSFAQGFVTAYAVLTYLIPVVVITCCYVGMASTLAGGRWWQYRDGTCPAPSDCSGTLPCFVVQLSAGFQSILSIFMYYLWIYLTCLLSLLLLCLRLVMCWCMLIRAWIQ